MGGGWFSFSSRRPISFMPTTTITDVCNFALGRLGARRISDFNSDESVEARACRQHFDFVRDGLLRRHQWDFATESLALSAVAEKPLSEWDTAWQLPADCVRIIRISSGERVRPVQEFERRGRLLLTNGLAQCELIYVTNTMEVPDWDSLFTAALVLKLASAIAGDVTQNPALATDALNELETLALPKAQVADARETQSGENFGVRNIIANSALVNARRHRGSLSKYHSELPVP